MRDLGWIKFTNLRHKGRPFLQSRWQTLPLLCSKVLFPGPQALLCLSPSAHSVYFKSFSYKSCGFCGIILIVSPFYFSSWYPIWPEDMWVEESKDNCISGSCLSLIPGLIGEVGVTWLSSAMYCYGKHTWVGVKRPPHKSWLCLVPAVS